MTPANRPALAEDPDAKTNPFMFRLDLLQNDRVRYANQPIAVVIAETLEAATEGAALLSPRYETEPARIGLGAAETFVPPVVGVGNPAKCIERRRRRRAGSAPSARDRGDLRDAGPVPQRHGAACDRRRLGRRQALRRHAEPGPRHGAGASRRTVRHLAGEHPTSAAPSSAAASARRASSPARRSSASSRPAWSDGRSSWCCAASRCTARSAIARRRARRCASARRRTAR